MQLTVHVNMYGIVYCDVHDKCWDLVRYVTHITKKFVLILYNCLIKCLILLITESSASPSTLLIVSGYYVEQILFHGTASTNIEYSIEVGVWYI